MCIEYTVYVHTLFIVLWRVNGFASAMDKHWPDATQLNTSTFKTKKHQNKSKWHSMAALNIGCGWVKYETPKSRWFARHSTLPHACISRIIASMNEVAPTWTSSIVSIHQKRRKRCVVPWMCVWWELIFSRPRPADRVTTLQFNMFLHVTFCYFIKWPESLRCTATSRAQTKSHLSLRDILLWRAACDTINDMLNANNTKSFCRFFFRIFWMHLNCMANAGNTISLRSWT